MRKCWAKQKKRLAGVKTVYTYISLLAIATNKLSHSPRKQNVYTKGNSREHMYSPCCMGRDNQTTSASWQESGHIAIVQKPKNAEGMNAKVANKRKQEISTDSQICVKRFSGERARAFKSAQKGE